MTKTVKFGIAGVVVAGVAALAIVAAKRNTTKPVDVRVEAVEARDLVASVTASGQIQPRTKVDVSADVTGKIVRLSVKEGDLVTKGQFLLQIDPEQATAAMQRATATLASARAQAAQAKANLIQAQRNYERSAQIQKQSPSLVSEEQLEQLRTQAEVNKALAEAANYSVEQAIASVRDARQALSRTTITAPMSGKVTRLNVEEGETAIMGTLNKDAATLLTISDMSVLETKVKVDETDVARISVGDSTVRENEELPQGDSAVTVGREPTKQVGKRDVEGVFIVGTDNTVSFRPVKVGIAGERHFEVLDGLKSGEKIVAGTYQAIRELKDGALVKPAVPDDKKAAEKKS